MAQADLNLGKAKDYIRWVEQNANELVKLIGDVEAAYNDDHKFDWNEAFSLIQGAFTSFGVKISFTEMIQFYTMILDSDYQKALLYLFEALTEED